MKKYSLKALISATCLMFLSFGLSANADAVYGIVEIAPNTYAFNVKSSNVTPGFNLESPPGNILSVFRVSFKLPVGSATSLTASSGAAPFSGLAATGPNLDATGVYYSFSFSGGTMPVSIPNSGAWTTLFTFTTIGTDVPVLWTPGDPMSVGPIGIDNLYNALAPSSTGGGNNYSMNMVVPVELTLFDVIKRNEAEGLVVWETASEQNTEHFEVERSDDGKSWSRIGTVKAEGTTDVTQNYSFLDKRASQNASFKGDVFYRLRILDYDGYQEFTEIRKINFTQRVSNIIAYPNPTADLTNVSGLERDADFQIVSKEGKIVMQGKFVSGNNELLLTDLPAGMYIIKIDSEGVQLPIVKTN